MSFPLIKTPAPSYVDMYADKGCPQKTLGAVAVVVVVFGVFTDAFGFWPVLEFIVLAHWNIMPQFRTWKSSSTAMC